MDYTGFEITYIDFNYNKININNSEELYGYIHKKKYIKTIETFVKDVYDMLKLKRDSLSIEISNYHEVKITSIPKFDVIYIKVFLNYKVYESSFIGYDHKSKLISISLNSTPYDKDISYIYLQDFINYILCIDTIFPLTEHYSMTSTNSKCTFLRLHQEDKIDLSYIIFSIPTGNAHRYIGYNDLEFFILDKPGLPSHT